MVAGWHPDSQVPQLYCCDPSGTFTEYKAKAIGAGSEGAQAELLDQYHSNLTLDEAKTLALKVLKQVMEEKLSAGNVQMALVTKEAGYHLLSEDEVKVLMANI